MTSGRNADFKKAYRRKLYVVAEKNPNTRSNFNSGFIFSKRIISLIMGGRRDDFFFRNSFHVHQNIYFIHKVMSRGGGCGSQLLSIIEQNQ